MNQIEREDYLKHFPIEEMDLIINTEEDYFLKYDCLKIDSPAYFFIIDDPIKLENGKYKLHTRPINNNTCRWKSAFYDEELEIYFAKLQHDLKNKCED